MQCNHIFCANSTLIIQHHLTIVINFFHRFGSICLLACGIMRFDCVNICSEISPYRIVWCVWFVRPIQKFNRTQQQQQQIGREYERAAPIKSHPKIDNKRSFCVVDCLHMWLRWSFQVGSFIYLCDVLKTTLRCMGVCVCVNCIGLRRHPSMDLCVYMHVNSCTHLLSWYNVQCTYSYKNKRDSNASKVSIFT